MLLFSLPIAFSIEHVFPFGNNLQFIVCDQENWDLCSTFQEQLYFVIEGELYCELYILFVHILLGKHR